MARTVDVTIKNFNRIATLNKNPTSAVDVYIATLNKNGQRNTFVVNSFKLSKPNQDLFKSFFFLYNSDNCPPEFTYLLTGSDRFFVIFRYDNTKNILDLFESDKNIYNYSSRCEMVEKIFFAMSKIENLPECAISCCTTLDNIYIDKNNEVTFCYNFENYQNFLDYGIQPAYENAADVVRLLLAKELKDSKIPFTGFYNKPYKLVLKKCQNHIYQNFPELLLDFKKAEKHCDVTDTKSAASQYLEQQKKRIKKYSIGLTVLTIIAILVILFYPFFIDTNIAGTETISIGEITYNKPIESMEMLEISEPPADPPKPFDYSTISIPEDADILYDEYIVQKDETLESICVKNYNNANLVNAVKTFNNIDTSEELIAGTVIKLPSASVIEEFVNASSEASSSDTSGQASDS